MKLIKKKCANKKCIQIFRVNESCKQEFCSGLCDRSKRKTQFKLKREWSEADRRGSFKERE